MSFGSVLLFPERAPSKLPWQNQELAELFRVRQFLLDAGANIGTDYGVSDEGDPWFVFFREDTSEVIVHFARIDSTFIAIAPLSRQKYSGRSLRDIANKLLKDQPKVANPFVKANSSVLFHPLVVLTAFVASGILLSHEARAETKAGSSPNESKSAHQANASFPFGTGVSRIGAPGSLSPSDTTTPIESVIANAISAAMLFAERDLLQVSLASTLQRNSHDTALIATAESVSPQILAAVELPTLLSSPPPPSTAGVDLLLPSLDPETLTSLQHVLHRAAPSALIGSLDMSDVQQPPQTTALLKFSNPKISNYDLGSLGVHDASSDASANLLFVLESQHLVAKLPGSPDYVAIDQGPGFSLVDFHLVDDAAWSGAIKDSVSSQSTPAASKALTTGVTDTRGAAESGGGGQLTKSDAGGSPIFSTHSIATQVTPPPPSVYLSGNEQLTLGSAAETIYFGGGNVTITNFIEGTDKLLVSNSLLMNQPFSLTRDGAGDWIIHVGPTAIVTLIGFVTHDHVSLAT